MDAVTVERPRPALGPFAEFPSPEANLSAQ